MGIGVTGPTAISTQAAKVGYDKELRMKSLLESIFTDLRGQYNTEKKSIPSAVYIDVDNSVAVEGSTTAVLTMKLKLHSPGVMGNTIAIGQEELPTTKSGRIHMNNCRKVISKPGYGRRKVESDYLRLYEQHVDDLADWNREEEDLEIHQAHLETYGETLRYGDTAAVCIPRWNRNVFVAGLDWRNGDVTYSTNLATHTGNIVAKLVQAGNGSLNPTASQTLGQASMSNISNWGLGKRINRLNIPGLPGNRGYLLVFSELQAMYIGDPAWSSRNLGSLFIAKTALPEKVQNWTGVLGAYKDLLLVQDVRLATVLPTGSSAPYGLTAGYMWHGDTDLRNRDHHHTREACMLLGAGAFVNWVTEPLHTIEQTDDYGAIVGVGSALVRGIQTWEADQDTPAVGTREQFVSGLVLCGLPQYT